MAPITRTTPVQQPMDASAHLVFFTLPDRALNSYTAWLSMRLPTLEQRGEMAAIAFWRDRDDSVITAGDLFLLLCRLERVDPNIEISDANAATLNRIVVAQKTIWRRLTSLAEGDMPDVAADDPGDAADEVQRWLESFFCLLATVEGLDASGIRHLLPPRVRETLTRQAARELLDTPFLLGHTLHQNADRFTNGPLSTHKLAIVLAAATRNAWQDTQGAPGLKVSQRKLANLAFWSHVLKGFMYGAAHSDRNTLAVEVAENIDDQDLLRDALLVYTSPDCSAWKHWTRGDGTDLNGRITNATVQELWDMFRAQLEAV